MRYRNPIEDLATHRVENQPTELTDYDLFASDVVLQEAVARHVGAGGGLCWHHIAPEDVASAFRRGLEYDYRGFDRFYLCANSTLYPTPTLDRVQSFFGALPARVDRDRYAVNLYAPLYDTSHARDRLGWTPQNDLRAQVVDRAPP